MSIMNLKKNGEKVKEEEKKHEKEIKRKKTIMKYV